MPQEKVIKDFSKATENHMIRKDFCLTLHFLLVSLFQTSFLLAVFILFYFIFTSLHANLEEFSCKLSNSFPEMHANFVKFFQDTSKFQKIYRLCSFKKEFAKWIDRHSVFQLCSGKHCLQITWFSLPSFGDQPLDNKRFILPYLSYTFICLTFLYHKK